MPPINIHFIHFYCPRSPQHCTLGWLDRGHAMMSYRLGFGVDCHSWTSYANVKVMDTSTSTSSCSDDWGGGGGGGGAMTATTVTATTGKATVSHGHGHGHGHARGNRSAPVGRSNVDGFVGGIETYLGLIGWRKKCLYTLLLLLMLLIITNLVLTLWILKVMEFSTVITCQISLSLCGILNPQLLKYSTTNL